jgi:prepilin-type N-terminal cleavage/methylation domain-containing protein
MRRRLKSRAGFSLVEVMVAMMLLVTVLSALATLSYRVTKRGQDNDLRSKRAFALQHEANRLGAMSFTELATQTNGSEAVVLGDFLFTRTLTLTAVSSTRYTIKILIEPDTDPTAVDSIIFDRTKPASATALCTSC